MGSPSGSPSWAAAESDSDITEPTQTDEAVDEIDKFYSEYLLKPNF
jgi:hypothetical protein